PTDPGAAGLHQDHNAADAGDVERGLHDLGAGLDCVRSTRVDIVDRDIGHPAFGNAFVVRTADVKKTTDRFIAHLGDPIGHPSAHRHRVEAPAHHVGVEFLCAFDVARHQLVPVEFSVRPGHEATPLLKIDIPTTYRAFVSLPRNSGKIFFQLVHGAGPAVV